MIGSLRGPSLFMPHSLPDADDDGVVNAHFLEHVVRSHERREVEASEDIMVGNGIKLLSEGSVIDGRMRERLLAHKLVKPLEQSVQVRNGISVETLGPIASRLLDSYPLIQTLCAPVRALPLTLSSLELSKPVQTLMTLYADAQGDRLRHCVGVAMLSLGLAHRLLPTETHLYPQLALAGLLHDIGELYIDSTHLHANGPLQADQWRHIATHPVIGWRVLRKMNGAGPEVADMVLNHHERFDGFGYPRGVLASELPLSHQVLAAAEWLMALVDSGERALARASVASRLIPGEFNPAIVELLNTATRLHREPLETPAPLLQALPTAERVGQTLERFRLLRPWIDECIAEAGPGLRAALELSLARLNRIQASFSSTGLDAGATLQDFAAMPDPQLHQELHLLINEFSWRLRQLEREALLRAGLLAPAELALMHRLVAQLRGELPLAENETKAA